MALIFRLIIVVVIAATAYVFGRGGFGWGGGGGNGQGAGDGGPSTTQKTDSMTGHAWRVRVSGDTYELNDKPLSLADMRLQLERAKEQIQAKRELVHVVVMPDARVNAVRGVKDLLSELGLSTAEENR